MATAEQLRASNPTLSGYEALRARIAAAFGDPARSGLATQAGQGIRDYNLMQLADERAKADREAGFQLARTGNVGGSVDIDSLRERDRITEDALRSTEADALSASNAYRANDANAQAQLHGQVNSGLGTGDAINSALRGVQYQGEQNLDALRGKAVGDAATQFATMAQAYGIGDARKRASAAASKLGLPSSYYGTLYQGG